MLEAPKSKPATGMSESHLQETMKVGSENKKYLSTEFILKKSRYVHISYYTVPLLGFSSVVLASSGADRTCIQCL